MSPLLRRTLRFTATDLGENTMLMLAFDHPIDGLYKYTFPVVWKAIRFGAKGPYNLTVTYQPQPAAIKPRVDSGDTIAVAAFKLINIGQETALNKDQQGVYRFTDPTAGAGDVVQMRNDCPQAQDLAFGVFRPNVDLIPDPLLYLPNVPSKSSAQAQFVPILRAYITDQYKAGQIIMEEVKTEALWTQNLIPLPENTIWILSRDKDTGVYRINQAL